MINWESLRGLQFENLMLDNVQDILTLCQIPSKNVVKYGPYYQTSTAKRQRCQIDLMILDRFQTLYLCEIKFRGEIGTEVIADVEGKINRLDYPKNHSVRPVLIYCGKLSRELQARDYFDKLVDVTILLK